MGLRSSDRETPTATFDELQAFRAKAIEMGHPSLATAALIGMGMAAARERHLRELRRDALPAEGAAERRARRCTRRRGEENWVPLFDDNGVPLYPELMAELDAIKRERIGGLMLCRDWGDRAPVADLAEADKPTSRT